MCPSEGALRSPAGFFAGFLAAMAFFRRLPIDPPAPSEWRLADAAWAFPLVGAGIGGAAALVILLAQLIGLAGWPAALLSVLAGVWFVGGGGGGGGAPTPPPGFWGGDRGGKDAGPAGAPRGTLAR